MTTKSTSQKVKATKVESKKTKALNPKVEEAKVKTSKKVKATKIELPSTKLEKKKSDRPWAKWGLTLIIKRK